MIEHLGDITKISGRTAPPVRVMIGGSPCQDLSVAGRRAGLDGERSSLFMEQIRIIKEMRETYGKEYPRYMVWENVPGAFTSNGGEDFRKVLEETVRVADENAIIPRPRRENGEQAVALWETDSPLLGVYSTHGFGESPSAAVESRLSQILEENPHPKYSLSEKACRGILRRAEQRGKRLPEMLQSALESRIAELTREK